MWPGTLDLVAVVTPSPRDVRGWARQYPGKTFFARGVLCVARVPSGGAALERARRARSFKLKTQEHSPMASKIRGATYNYNIKEMGFFLGSFSFPT